MGALDKVERTFGNILPVMFAENSSHPSRHSA